DTDGTAGFARRLLFSLCLSSGSASWTVSRARFEGLVAGSRGPLDRSHATRTRAAGQTTSDATPRYSRQTIERMLARIAMSTALLLLEPTAKHPLLLLQEVDDPRPPVVRPAGQDAGEECKRGEYGAHRHRALAPNRKRVRVFWLGGVSARYDQPRQF